MKLNKKIKILDFKLSKILNGGLFGAYKSNFSGSGMEFSEHKEYSFGDQVKDIDWKASSKTDNMYVKKYEEQRDLNVLFVLDNTSSMNFGSTNITKKELLEELFYSLALSAYYNNDNIGALIFDEEELKFIEQKKSKSNIYKILDILQTKKKNKTKKINKFKTIFEYLINRGFKENLIFIITDETDNIDEKLLSLLGAKNEIIFINVFDIIENNLFSIDGNITLNLGAESMEIALRKDKVLEYRKLRKNKIKKLSEIFRKNSIGYINMDTNSDIFSKLMGYFSKIRK